MLNPLLHPPTERLIRLKPQPQIHLLHLHLRMNKYQSLPPANTPGPITSPRHLRSRSINLPRMLSRPFQRRLHQPPSQSLPAILGDHGDARELDARLVRPVVGRQGVSCWGVWVREEGVWWLRGWDEADYGDG